MVVDSHLIAQELGVAHKAFMETIRKYEKQTEQAFGILRLQNGTVTNSVRATNTVEFVYLTSQYGSRFHL